MNQPAPAQPRIDHVGDLPVGARNADLSDLAEMLKTQHAAKVDVVAPATALRSENGLWRIDGTEPVVDASGVTQTTGTYRPTAVADEGVADKLGIPTGYLRRMRQNRPDLYDANVNGWLHGATAQRVAVYDTPEEGYGYEVPGAAPDPRSFLVRCFRAEGDGVDGVARAFLSDRYRIVDNLDVLTAALDGVRQSGADVAVEAADLTDRRMMVRVTAPDIRAYAPDLLAGYRSPFDGRQVGGNWTPERVAEASAREGQALNGDEPVVFAGFVISNSETGGGAFTITPRLVVQVCRNGLTIAADALRSVHLGGKLDDGVVRWSDETQHRNLELVASQARDAVATFLDVDYVRAKVDAIESDAGKPVDRPQDTVRHVAKSLRFGEDAADGILDHFIRGGQTTAGGVMQAVTSYAQTLDDAEAAAEAEAAAFDALALAAS